MPQIWDATARGLRKIPLLGRERGDDLFEAGIAAERIPKWEQL
jgi:hypothetical protein